MENVYLKINNYKHTEQEVRKLKNKLYFLTKQIPCDARVLLDFEYKDKIFHGKLKVICNKKTFFSTDKDPMLFSLTGSLCKKIQKQVLKWKQNRNPEEITGVRSLKARSLKKGHSLSSYQKVM